MIYPQNFEQKIGFDQIRSLIKGKCLSPLGEERVDAMRFSAVFGDVEERLELVAEFVRLLQTEDSFPVQYFFDVRPSLKRIRIEGMYLDEQELFDLRRSLETIRDITRFLLREEETETSPYPRLKHLANDIDVFPECTPFPLREDEGQCLTRTGTHPARTKLHDGKHLADLEQHLAKRPVRRRSRQGRDPCHA